ncbi:hypothetical protein Tco_0475880 [Tanacetum coccineum]
MVAFIILISSDSFEECVGSSISRVILFGTILTVIPADVPTIITGIPVATTVVAAPVGVVVLDIHTTSETNPFEDPSFPVHALAVPITSLFLCSDSFRPSKICPEQ